MWAGLSMLVAIVHVGLVFAGRKACSDVKKSFITSSKPTVAATILSDPEHDGSLELCVFTNHTSSKRPSCCTHATENELLNTAQADYSTALHRETAKVFQDLGPESRLTNHYERTLAISKRMTEYELGSTLKLHHQAGRQAITDFYDVLGNILLSHNRTTSVFKAINTLRGEMLLYVIREAVTPGSRDELTPDYASCVKKNWENLYPSPFSQQSDNEATSLHYSAIAGSYLSEAMNVTFQALNYTRDYQVSSHCLRDIVKIKHCQKCYGYGDLKPCRFFCDDVLVVCLNSLVKLDTHWEFHRKVVKILSAYILTKVNLQSLLNGFHTTFKASLEGAIIEYPNYKEQLEGLCGNPQMVTRNVRTRLKVWDKPSTTDYDGDLSGDLGKLVVNMEKNIVGFYGNLYSSICATDSEPVSGLNCWDGLTERVNKRKKIALDFQDRFSATPKEDPVVEEMIKHISSIRTRVLKIFVKDSNRESDDELEGSGSGDDGVPDDDEDGHTPTSVTSSKTISPLKQNVVVKPEGHNTNTVAGPIRPETWKSGNVEKNVEKDNSIEIVEEVPILKVELSDDSDKLNTGKPNAGSSAVKDTESSAHTLRLSVAFLWTNLFLVIFYVNH